MPTLDNTALSLVFGAVLNNALDMGVVATAPLAYPYSKAFSTGVGAGQADQMFFDQRNIAASGNDDLDLTGTALQNALGVNIAFARIKILIIEALGTNVNNLIVGNAAANPWVGPFGAGTHTNQVRPGGALIMVCSDITGWPVVAGTGDILRVANGGAGSAVDYKITLVGATA
jgi:hypothetical protein